MIGGGIITPKHMGRRGIDNSRPIPKYLDVTLDSAIIFRRHLEDALGRAMLVATAVGRLMPSMGELSMAKRTLLPVVSSSCLITQRPCRLLAGWGCGEARSSLEKGHLQGLARDKQQ